MNAAGDAAHPALDGGVHPPPLQGPPRSVVGRLAAWVHWFGVGRLVAAAVSVLVVLVGGWWLVHPPAAPVEAALPHAGAGSVIPATLPAPPGAPSRSVPVSLVVHVAGAVHHPGVYAVPPGAPVIDATALAGGSGGEADPAALPRRVRRLAAASQGASGRVPPDSDGDRGRLGGQAVAGHGGAAARRAPDRLRHQHRLIPTPHR